MTHVIAHGQEQPAARTQGLGGELSVWLHPLRPADRRWGGVPGAGATEGGVWGALCTFLPGLCDPKTAPKIKPAKNEN